MTEITELKQRINALEQEIARLLPYRDRLRFIADCRVDIVHVDADPEIHLPASVQLQKATGSVDPGTANPTYALLAMHPSLIEAIDHAMIAHAHEVPEPRE